jgi:hypothetical protein
MNAQEHPPEDEIQSGEPRSVSTTGRGRGSRRRRFGGARLSVLMSLAILAVIVVLVGLARTAAGRNATASLGIRTQREPYTALSFTGANLAKLGFTGVHYHGSLIHDHFSFRITDAEHHAQRYFWTVDFDPAGRTYRGSVFLRAGASRTVTQTVLFPCDADVAPARRHLHTILVRVSLRPSRESIDFQQQCDD